MVFVELFYKRNNTREKECRCSVQPSCAVASVAVSVLTGISDPSQSAYRKLKLTDEPWILLLLQNNGVMYIYLKIYRSTKQYLAFCCIGRYATLTKRVKVSGREKEKAGSDFWESKHVVSILVFRPSCTNTGNKAELAFWFCLLASAYNIRLNSGITDSFVIKWKRLICGK